MRSVNTYLPMNLGCGNRGCEAIARGTCEILSLDRSRTYFYDSNAQEMKIDSNFGLDSIGELRSYSANNIYSFAERVFHKVMNKANINRYLSSIYPYSTMIDSINEDDLLLLTGGDLYCYEFHVNKNTQFIKELKKRNKGKIVLWGASIEPTLLTQESIEGLKALDRITVRESLTYSALLELGIDKNVELYADPAFVLKPKFTKLPEYFLQADVIGINISNLVNGGFELNTTFSVNLINLIENILNSSEMHVLLIPHVTWKGQDDRIISKLIAERFADTKRVHFLEMDNLSYQEIRYVISKCRFFIGARTHSMISAYSTCIPSIALGYSIKAVGIAKDLGLPDNLVVNCKKLTSDNNLLDAFNYLVGNENQIRDILSDKIEDYTKSAYAAREALTGILY